MGYQGQDPILLQKKPNNKREPSTLELRTNKTPNTWLANGRVLPRTLLITRGNIKKEVSRCLGNDGFHQWGTSEGYRPTIMERTCEGWKSAYIRSVCMSLFVSVYGHLHQVSLQQVEPCFVSCICFFFPFHLHPLSFSFKNAFDGRSRLPLCPWCPCGTQGGTSTAQHWGRQ